jgi:hypothetical protein
MVNPFMLATLHLGDDVNYCFTSLRGLEQLSVAQAPTLVYRASLRCCSCSTDGCGVGANCSSTVMKAPVCRGER